MDSLIDTLPCGYLSFADDGIILAANATLSAWLGCESGGLVGRTLESLLPVASRIFYQTHFFPLLKMSGHVEEVYFTLRTALGEDLPVLVNAIKRTRNETPGEAAVYDCVFMVVRQRNQYEDEILKTRRGAEEARLWLSTTLQSIGDAVIATDAEGKIAFLNSVAEELTGWPQCEALGKPLDEVFIIINEKTRLPVESPISMVLREKRIVGLENHTLLVSRDGTHRPIDDSGAPIRGSSGEVLGVVLVFRDFTERRQSEQTINEHQDEIETLNLRLQRAMTETHHRVKNNLQIISALIDLQLFTDREMVPMSELRRLGQSIRALGVIHDILTKESQSGTGEGKFELISVKEVLNKLLPMLEASGGAQTLDYTVEDARIPGKQITGLTLITNELVSNAVKHGKGRVEVRFLSRNDIAVMEVQDDGPGFPNDFDSSKSSNTGLDLIENITKWDLQGTATFTTAKGGGGLVTISFPLPSG